MTATVLNEIDIATPRRKWPRYPDYKPSGMAWVHRVPNHWRVYRLKNIALVRFSTVDKKTEEGEIPVRLCNYTDVYNNDRIVDDPEFMQATATPEEIARFALKKDDVLITKDSEEWYDIAVPAYVTQDMPGVLCGYHLALVRPNSAIVDGAYLSRAFAADGIRQQFHVAANGITRYGLPNRAISGALFPLPPLEEQRAIAAFLDRETARIDELIAKKQRLIELLKEKRQAVISRAVTKGLDPNAPMKPSGIDWLDDVPRHWEIRPLKYQSFKIGSGKTPRGGAQVYVSNGVMLIRSQNIHDEGIRLEDVVFIDDKVDEEMANTRVKPGDVLLNITGASIGRC
ncbi:MAG: restriction endonuclease subunit S, partial [Gemmataceae bacterium]|nr:restriction endonuclease subunit S [Gemmataceae bacterium]